MEIYCPLDDAGRYLDDGQMPASLVGLSVLGTKKGCEANEGVLALLRENGSLLHLEHHSHQYPHCWRSKTPVVFRAMDQWFVSLDKDDIRNAGLDALDEVAFTPEWGRNRIRGFLEARPDWCISRQRSWGVPIPVFFDEEGEPLLDANLIRSFADKVEHGGTDLWFELSAEELLAGVDLPESWKGKTLVKGSDTLDVWIDSGCSHRAVLRQKEDLKWPADLYLEGSDQHRGWFQSSLWTALLADGAPPYAHIITHGFVVDGDGRKISKSDGKPQTVESYIKRYGADVLRLWICSEDFRRDIPLSEEILDQVVRGYRTIRNTFRFQIGNLFDFDRQTDSIPLEQLSPIDLWALDNTADLIEDVTKAFDAYEFHRGIQFVNRYCSNVLSSVYHDVLKDRLYTFSPNDPLRRSSQTALDHIFQVLVKLLAPVIPFTTDEAWAYLEEGSDFCLEPLALQAWPEVDSAWRGGAKVEDVRAILAFKTTAVNEALEKLRVEKVIGQSLDAEVQVFGHPDNESFAALSRNEDCLAELFITSSVILTADPNAQGEPTVEVRHASGIRCPRSWRWVPELTHVEPWGEVSSRCAEALSTKAIS
jgi:isoleucyl-tRNA synthetase